MTNDPIAKYDELIERVKRTHERSGNLTGAIRFVWPEWKTLIGRGAPFRSFDAACSLGVTKSVIDKAHYIIKRESTVSPSGNAPSTLDETDAGTYCSQASNPPPSVERRQPDYHDDYGNGVWREGRWIHTYVRKTQKWQSDYR